MKPPHELAETVRVLAFDVFGTVVDWHGTIAREIDALQLGVDGSQFALAWRAGYVPAMRKVASGELGWTLLDALHRQILDEILARFGLDRLAEDQRRELNRVWHRLDGWPDAVEGLTRLKRRYTLCTLSNGNIGLLTDMAKHAGLPWDCILSAEVFRKYKPDPDVYRGVARIFDIADREVLMVAAHHSDLLAAESCGLRSAYVERPHEYGAVRPPETASDHALRARDLIELATQLGC
jgi:2-haloacid dehalogenase